jgi:starch synthase
MYYALNRGAQFVLLGSATDSTINDWFWHEKRHLTDNPDIHLELSFNEELAHLIYAGADMMVVPSKFEPCGLTQLISMRYGTIPIVRGVGGLVSTVFDWDYDTFHPQEERTGFVFYESDNYALESGMNRALDLYYDEPAIFQQLAQQGMQYDHSWKKSGQEYIKMYDYIRHK